MDNPPHPSGPGNFSTMVLDSSTSHSRCSQAKSISISASGFSASQSCRRHWVSYKQTAIVWKWENPHPRAILGRCKCMGKCPHATCPPVKEMWILQPPVGWHSVFLSGNPHSKETFVDVSPFTEVHSHSHFYFPRWSLLLARVSQKNWAKRRYRYRWYRYSYLLVTE